MFKFIHAADIHLDSPLKGLSRYESVPEEALRGACRRAFENLVDLAINERVAFVLLAGDLYDGDWRDYSTGIYLSQQIGRLRRQNIPAYAVAGNHDAANTMTKSLGSPDSLHILSARDVETLRLDEVPVAIHGRSFSTRHVDENLAAGFGPAVKGLFNIGLLHTSLDGREGHGVYAPCSLEDLQQKGYHYWALGHVHRYEIVSEDPLVVFPGCIQGRHIGETGRKGCMLVQVENMEVTSSQRIDLDVLRWVRCSVDLTDIASSQEVLERTRQAIEYECRQADGRFVAMRIQFEGATEMYEKLAAYPEQFEQQIRSIGAEYGEHELWIERVESSVAVKLNYHSVVSDNSALGMLLQEIAAIPNNSQDINGLGDILNMLRGKIPPDVFDENAAIRLDDQDALARVVEEAKNMLIGKLLIQRGTE